MEGADLREATIYKTDLVDARLGGADLRDTAVGFPPYPGPPRKARIMIDNPPTTVRLFRADLEGAKLDGSQFYETDLHGVKGLTSKQLKIICVDTETKRSMQQTFNQFPRTCAPEEKPKPPSGETDTYIFRATEPKER
jgi:hypothetical protein